MVKGTAQKINLMSTLTSFKTFSEKIIENSSLKNKKINKMIDANSKKGAIFHRSVLKPPHSNGKKDFK